MKRLLLPHTDVLTPNLPEAQALTGINIETAEMRNAPPKFFRIGV